MHPRSGLSASFHIATALRQRGLALLEVTLLTLVVAGALAAGLIALKSRQASNAAQAELAALTQADSYLQGFVAGRGRLPCPDTDGDGFENCNGTQKGKLPYRTLGLEGSTAAAGVGSLAYLVQMSAANLTAIEAATFEPVAWSDPNYNGRRNLATLGTADFCQALINAAAVTPAVGQAHVGDVAAGGYPVAYALAHPGLRQAGTTAAGGFDGLNGSGANAMELPETGGLLGSYDDRVVVRTYQGLGQSLDCDRWRKALDTLSLATAVIEEVESQRTSITLSAGVLTTISGIKAIVFGIKTYGAASSLGVATTGLGTASALLASAIASCAVLVGCFEIPHAAASVAAFAVAVGAAVAAIALNVAGAVASVVAFGITTAAAVAAGNQVGANTIDLSSARTSAKASWDQAVIDTGKAKTALDQNAAALTNASTDKDARWNSLIAASHAIVARANSLNQPNAGTLAQDMLDNEFVSVRDKVDAWKLAEESLRAAEADLKLAQDSAKNNNANASAGTASAIKAIQDKLGTESDPAKRAQLAEQLRTETDPAKRAALQAQLGTESDPQKRKELQDALDTLTTGRSASTNAAIKALEDQLATETDPAKRADLQASIARLKAPQSTSSNADQIAQLKQQIDGIAAQIAQMDARIAALPVGSAERADLIAQRDALRAQSADLTQQLKVISLTVAEAQANMDAAKGVVSTAKQAFETAYAHAINQFKPESKRLPYARCRDEKIEPPPKDPPLTRQVCETNYLDGLNVYVGSDGPDAISPKVYGLFNINFTQFYWGPFSPYPQWMTGAKGAYFTWWDYKQRTAQLQLRYDDAVTKEASAKSSYETLLNMSATSAGGSGTNAIWGAPLDMLKQIEQNGAIR
ncbi:hypothetical protein [Acidovorax sp. FG27]|uniref:hypothetical protein n=1 Tax=Acidovorax sp. FG27 TaxID=3133652 RepID=UPI0030E85EC7